jgi:hypothetical protein
MHMLYEAMRALSALRGPAIIAIKTNAIDVPAEVFRNYLPKQRL